MYAETVTHLLLEVAAVREDPAHDGLRCSSGLRRACVRALRGVQSSREGYDVR